MNSKHEVVEKKIAMEKSSKSRCSKDRCCKVDAVKVKGLPGGGLFDIGVYKFFRPRRVAIYVLRTNLTPNQLQLYLLASKEKRLKT
jgi:hypothetical protein